MALTRKTIEELRANPFKLSVEQRRRTLAMTEEEIEALTDPDNPPWTDDDLAKACRERDERLAAEKRRA